MKHTKLYGVVLAGGEGTRLWPLSRKRRPKELLSFIREASFLEQSITRISSLIPLSQRWAITTDEQSEAIQLAVGDQVGTIITEPDARGTAASLTLTCLLIAQQDPDAVVVFLPTDHYIPQTQKFLEFITHAIDFTATSSQITLLGLKALYPTVDYGYIAYKDGSTFPAPVQFFHEKPPAQFCAQYVQEGWLWNSGIVVTQVGTFLETCKIVAPELFQSVFAYLFEDGDYYGVPQGSVGTLILEKAMNCSVLPADFVWCDVGNLESFLSLRDQMSGQQNVVTIDAQDNLVEVQDSLVALVGVDNLCVVQNDDVLLVVNRNQLDKIKLVIEVLKRQHNEDYL